MYTCMYVVYVCMYVVYTCIHVCGVCVTITGDITMIYELIKHCLYGEHSLYMDINTGQSFTRTYRLLPLIVTHGVVVI